MELDCRRYTLWYHVTTFERQLASVPRLLSLRRTNVSNDLPYSKTAKHLHRSICLTLRASPLSHVSMTSSMFARIRHSWLPTSQFIHFHSRMTASSSDCEVISDVLALDEDIRDPRDPGDALSTKIIQQLNAFLTPRHTWHHSSCATSCSDLFSPDCVCGSCISVCGPTH
jgi:hypothetical protein